MEDVLLPPSGQSYEIRLLENRKLGDFQDLNTKYVKVSEPQGWPLTC